MSVVHRPELDADLRSIVDAWPDLPAVLRAGIVAMVKGAGCQNPTGDSECTSGRAGGHGSDSGMR
ncbi:MAG: hypothetical protein IT447_05065 [Phycisphaerales bacterium]|nr:hypothetical protein [Phycisphaerales bacterium]